MVVKQIIGWAVIDAKGEFVAPEQGGQPRIMDQVTAKKLAELENSLRQVIEIHGFARAK